MKIELLQDLPIEGKHGMTQGRILEVVRIPDFYKRRSVRWFVMGDEGEEIGVLRHKANRHEEEPDDVD